MSQDDPFGTANRQCQGRVYFTQETFNQLKRFIIDKHGRQRARQITIQQAVREFLERRTKCLKYKKEKDSNGVKKGKEE